MLNFHKHKEQLLPWLKAFPNLKISDEEKRLLYNKITKELQSSKKEEDTDININNEEPY